MKQHQQHPQADGAVTEFELQRQARIKRNQQVLCDLGLENAGRLMAPAPPKRKPRPNPNKRAKQQPAGAAAADRAEPTRKSRRLKGGRPEIEDPRGSRRRWDNDENDKGDAADGSQHYYHQQQQQRPSKQFSRSRPRPAGGGGGDGDEQQQEYSSWDGRIDKAAVEALLQREPDNPHHMHNIGRLRSMSCKALVTRVRRIKNVAKLQSFVKVLEVGGGPPEVLEAAEEALRSCDY